MTPQQEIIKHRNQIKMNIVRQFKNNDNQVVQKFNPVTSNGQMSIAQHRQMTIKNIYSSFESVQKTN